MACTRIPARRHESSPPAKAISKTVSVLKLAIVGQRGCGKTAWITRFRTGHFHPIYNMTTTTVKTAITLNTRNHDKIQFEIFELEGSEDFIIPPELGIQGVIVMFALDSRLSYRQARIWISKLRHQNYPIVLCGNKCDLRELKVFLTYDDVIGMPYYPISAKSNYNLEKPLLSMACWFLRDKSVNFE